MNTQAFEVLCNHAQEISSSRVGGFGGSDAKMFRKVGMRGLSALSNTDMKRIAVAMGILPPFDCGTGTAAQQAGHDFEDYADRYMHGLPSVEEWREEGVHVQRMPTIERERLLTSDLARNFKTFAHADFWLGEPIVVECKYSQKTTEEVAKRYAEQLQWYYMMGAREVVLMHGWGDVLPFLPDGLVFVNIDANDQMQDALCNGIHLIDENWERLLERLQWEFGEPLFK